MDKNGRKWIREVHPVPVGSFSAIIFYQRRPRKERFFREERLALDLVLVKANVSNCQSKI